MVTKLLQLRPMSNINRWIELTTRRLRQDPLGLKFTRRERHRADDDPCRLPASTGSDNATPHPVNPAHHGTVQNVILFDLVSAVAGTLIDTSPRGPLPRQTIPQHSELVTTVLSFECFLRYTGALPFTTLVYASPTYDVCQQHTVCTFSVPFPACLAVRQWLTAHNTMALSFQLKAT